MDSAEIQRLVVAAVIAVAVVLVVRFEIFCLKDLAGARQVRYLSKPGWAAACLLVIPIGGILYLACGRAD